MDRHTGALRLDGGHVIDAALDLPTFLASPLAVGARRSSAPVPPASRYTLTPHQIEGVPWGIALTFRGEVLDRVTLWRYEPPPADGWASWSEDAERRLEAEHDAWLTKTAGRPPYRGAWGKAESRYDPRDGTSTIVITYAH